MRVSEENKLHQDRMESRRTFAVLAPGSFCLFVCFVLFFCEKQTHKCCLNSKGWGLPWWSSG